MRYFDSILKQICITVVALLLIMAVSFGQTVKISCNEKEKKNEEGTDPILIKTCLIKNYKFITTSTPDYAGRYVFHEYEVFVKKDNKYVRTNNSSVFNKNQKKLLDTINTRIQVDFNNYRSDSSTRECFTGIDSIPTYKMDELGITFYDDEIGFVVHWELSMACRDVDGTIITFKVNDIKQYFK